MPDVGYAYAFRLREPLKTRGDVHAVAENIPFVKNDVTEINPNAMHDLPVSRAQAFAIRHRGLGVDCAPHGVPGGGELRQHSVAGGLTMRVPRPVISGSILSLGKAGFA